jgi:hypothetical protein
MKEFKEQLTRATSISPAANVIHEECKHTELQSAKKFEVTQQEERKKSEEDAAKKI